MNAIARIPGSLIYPTRNFAQFVLKVSQEAGLYLDLRLSWMIPDVKSLRVPWCARAFPADCPHVRLIFTARRATREYRTAVRGDSRIWSGFTKASDD